MLTTIILVVLWLIAVAFLLGIMFSLGWHTAKCLFRDTARATAVIRVEPEPEPDDEDVL